MLILATIRLPITSNRISWKLLVCSFGRDTTAVYRLLQIGLVGNPSELTFESWSIARLPITSNRISWKLVIECSLAQFKAFQEG